MAFEAFVDELDRGGGGTLVLVGAAGIGKTRLLDDLVGTATDASLHIVRVGCSELEPTVPGALARRVGLALSHTDDSAETLADAALQAAPLVCVVDDAQWLDAASLAHVLALAHAANEGAVGLVVATRPPGPSSTTLTRLLAALERRGARVLPIEPLTDTDVLELVRDVTDRPIDDEQLALLHAAAGNPFLVVELADSWRRGVRPGPENVLSHTLGHLAPATRTLLDHASVFGRSALLVDLAHMAGGSAARLTEQVVEATASGLVEADDRGLRFRHDLIREAIYGALPAAVRGALHLEAARALEARGVTAVELAVHLVEGALPGDEDAIDQLRQASTGVAAVDLQAATALLEAARRLCTPSSRTTAAIDERLVILYAWTGRSDDARTTAEVLLRGATSAEEDARLRAVLAEALARGGDEAAAALVAEPLLDRTELPATLRATLHLLAATGTWQTDPSRCRELVAEARQLGGDDHRIEQGAIELDAVAYSAEVRIAEYVEHSARGVAFARSSADRGLPLASAHLLWACANAGEAAWAAEGDAEALRLFAEAEQHARRSGLVPTWVPDLMGLRAEVHMVWCRWDDALADIEAREELLAEHGRPDTSASGVPVRLSSLRARVGVLTGADDAGEHLERWGAVASPGVERARWRAWIARHAHVRDDQRARSHVEAIAAELRSLSVPRVIGWYVPWLDLHRLLAAWGHDADADHLADAMLPVCDHNAWLPRWRAAASVVRARRARDATMLAGTAELARTVEAPLLRFLTAASVSATASDLGDDALGRSMADVATELAGAHRLALGGTASRRVRRATTGWASLTPSEVRVARLVAEGLTNRAIAEELLVSTYTVESHLKHIFQKLHLTRRVQLAMLVAEEQRGA